MAKNQPDAVRRFGIQLQRAREAAGLSQSELAKAIGIPVGSVKNYEQGRREPKLFVAVKLAATLKVSVESLVS